MDDSYKAVTTLVGGGQATTPTSIASINTIAPITAGDSVTLPQAAPGLRYKFANAGANSGNIYPLGATDVINALAVQTAFALATAKSVEFVCVVAGQWWTFPRVAS